MTQVTTQQSYDEDMEAAESSDSYEDDFIELMQAAAHAEADADQELRHELDTDDCGIEDTPSKNCDSPQKPSQSSLTHKPTPTQEDSDDSSSWR